MRACTWKFGLHQEGRKLWIHSAERLPSISAKQLFHGEKLFAGNKPNNPSSTCGESCYRSVPMSSKLKRGRKKSVALAVNFRFTAVVVASFAPPSAAFNRSSVRLGRRLASNVQKFCPQCNDFFNGVYIDLTCYFNALSSFSGCSGKSLSADLFRCQLTR